LTKWIVSLVLISTLCACGGSTSSTDPTHAAALATGSAGSTGSAAATGPAASAGSAAASSDGMSAQDAAGGLSPTSIPDQVCIFLSEEIIKLSRSSSAVMARANLGGHYKTWQAADKNRKFAENSELDAIGKAHCPKVRARILDVVHSSTLALALKPS
jgi:hypothetical protein